MKQLMFIAVVLLCAQVTMAQRKATTHFGIKAGVNLANLKIENASDGDHRVGFHVGGLAHIHIARQFAIQPELVFSTQGRRQTINNVEYQTNLSYINVPVLAQYMTGSGFRLQTGPQLGFLVDAESGVEGSEVNVDKNYDALDISWAIGASYLTKSGLGFDARYNIGLRDINDLNNVDIRNRVWQIGLFYQFMHK
jgi:hypothetical protein